MGKGNGTTRSTSARAPRGLNTNMGGGSMEGAISEALRRAESINISSVELDGDSKSFPLGNGVTVEVDHFSGRGNEKLIMTSLYINGEPSDIPGYIDSYSIDGRGGTRSDAEVEAKDHIRAMIRRLGR